MHHCPGAAGHHTTWQQARRVISTAVSLLKEVVLCTVEIEAPFLACPGVWLLAKQIVPPGTLPRILVFSGQIS